MRYCVLYPNTSNVNLIKDMGMIPYKLHKLYGYDAWIACHKKGEYPYLENEVKGLKIDFIGEDHGNYIIDGCKYLFKNSKRIDILNIYHMTSYSMAYAFLYKVLNPKGKIYLKLDCSEKLVERLDSMNGLERLSVKKFLDKVDLISCEQVRLMEPLRSRFGRNRDKLVQISNGIDPKFIEAEITEKENCFLHIARLGSPEKNTENILEGFERFSRDNKQWKLVLAGSMEDGFKNFYEEFISQNPGIKENIEYLGEINDRNRVYEQFKRCKAFILNSEFESFAFVLIEAAFFSDYIITTDVGVADELKECCNMSILEDTSPEAVSASMREIAERDAMGEREKNDRQMVEDRYNYNNIIKKLKGYIDKKLNSCK